MLIIPPGGFVAPAAGKHEHQHTETMPRAPKKSAAPIAMPTRGLPFVLAEENEFDISPMMNWSSPPANI